jgi:hypothetical protein
LKAIAGTCNLKSLGLALHNYASAVDALPAAYYPDRFGLSPTDSWRMALLPFTEQVETYNSCNFQFSWNEPENSTTCGRWMNAFLRQADKRPDRPITKFVAVVGPETAFPDTRNLTFADIKDGLSTTFMFGEVAESDILWSEPRDLRFHGMDLLINGPRKKMGLGSPYGGPKVVLMDGSVKVLKDGTSPGVLRSLFTAAGGETLEGEGPDWKLGAAR